MPWRVYKGHLVRTEVIVLAPPLRDVSNNQENGKRFQISFFFSGNLLDRIYDKQNRLLNSELPRHPFYIGLDPCGHKFQRGGQKVCIQRELFRPAEDVLQFARWCDFREWMFLLTVL